MIKKELAPSALTMIGITVRFKGTNYHWHHRHLDIPQLFQFSGKIQLLLLLLLLYNRLSKQFLTHEIFLDKQWKLESFVIFGKPETQK